MIETDYRLSRSDMNGRKLPGDVPARIVTWVCRGIITPFMSTMDIAVFHDPVTGDFFRLERDRYAR